MASRSFIFLLIISVVYLQVAYCGEKWSGKPEYKCINFASFAPHQFCKNLCTDIRHNDLNVFAYLHDQKKYGENYPKIEHCYYSLGTRQTNDVFDPELPDL